MPRVEIRPPLFFTFLIKQQDGMPMAVLCVEDLDHLVLTVADIKATCRFYQQVLGMTPFTFGNGRTALSFGNRKINLHEVGKVYLPQAHNPLPGTADLCFLSRTPAVEMLDHLKANGVPVEEGPVRREGALGPITSVYFRDPDGNLIEVANYTEAWSFREVCHARFAFHKVFSLRKHDHSCSGGFLVSGGQGPRRRRNHCAGASGSGAGRVCGHRRSQVPRLDMRAGSSA